MKQRIRTIPKAVFTIQRSYSPFLNVAIRTLNHSGMLHDVAEQRDIERLE